MEPTLHHGDRLLVRRCAAHRLRPGDVVVLEPPDVRLGGGDRWYGPTTGSQVKRVVAGPGQPVPAGVRCVSTTVPAGTVVVFSDNAGVGVDSRAWGPYPARGVVGVVVRRLSPSGGDVGRQSPAHVTGNGRTGTGLTARVPGARRGDRRRDAWRFWWAVSSSRSR